MSSESIYESYIQAMAKLQAFNSALTKHVRGVELDLAETRADKEAQFKRWDRDLKELRKIQARMSAVKRLHRKVKVKHVCEDGCLLCTKPECETCRRNWPCPTYKAVVTDGDLDADV